MVVDNDQKLATHLLATSKTTMRTDDLVSTYEQVHAISKSLAG